jgi:hypothetical protein
MCSPSPYKFFPCYICDGNDVECDCRTHPWASQYSSFLPTEICPNKVDKSYYDAIQMYYWIEKGILPDNGCLLDQSATFVDIMPFISSYITKCQDEVRKETNG